MTDASSFGNPFRESQGKSVDHTSVRQGASTKSASKKLAEEIRQGDADMSKDLSALAPRSVRSYRMASTATSANSLPAKTEQATLEVHENITTNDFVAKKREVGLVRMSLATKRAEIRKLEEDIDRAEKKLHQQQDQLENTREKFNNFLKHSNLEQDAAVRRADSETKAKQEKAVEIKKLSALIGHVELEIKKTELQLENCKTYKKFLDDLVKPKWFADVLVELRVQDLTQQVLQDTEEAFARRSDEICVQYEKDYALLQAWEQKQAENANKFYLFAQNAAEEEEKPVVIPLDEQLTNLHDTMEMDAREAVSTATDRINIEVASMTADEIRAELEKNYESRMPTYFKDVDQLLEVFINVEEGNLFLIQNCQELEEELEEVASEFMTEKNEMQLMTQQRHKQMESLSEKIRIAQAKMEQLEERSRALDTVAGAVAEMEKKKQQAGKGGAAKPAGTDAKAKEIPMISLSPEEFKTRVEASIARIFRTMTTGDNTIAALASARQVSQENETLEEEEELLPGDRSPSLPEPSAKAARMAKAAKPAPPVHRPQLLSGRHGSPLGRNRRSKSIKKKEAGNGANTHPGAEGGNEAGANMGPVEMLTIIENKLEEYHRFITEHNNGVEETLIQAVMKASDKERRRQARLVHMEKQAAEQEERIRKALERAQAPVLKRTGKPVLPRSRMLDDGAGNDRRSAAGPNELEDDGAEFFS